MSLGSKRRRKARREAWQWDQAPRPYRMSYREWKLENVIDIPDFCRTRAHLRDWERATGLVLR